MSSTLQYHPTLAGLCLQGWLWAGAGCLISEPLKSTSRVCTARRLWGLWVQHPVCGFSCLDHCPEQNPLPGDEESRNDKRNVESASAPEPPPAEPPVAIKQPAGLSRQGGGAASIPCTLSPVPETGGGGGLGISDTCQDRNTNQGWGELCKPLHKWDTVFRGRTDPPRGCWRVAGARERRQGCHLLESSRKNPRVVLPPWPEEGGAGASLPHKQKGSLEATHLNGFMTIKDTCEIQLTLRSQSDPPPTHPANILLCVHFPGFWAQLKELVWTACAPGPAAWRAPSSPSHAHS